MSMTIYDRIRKSDWVDINRTFGDTEVYVHYRHLKMFFTVPFDQTPNETFDLALAEFGKLVAEYKTLEEVTKALRP